MLFIFALSLLFLFSCSPQKRLTRIIENHPELIQIDTIFDYDTIIYENLHTDTLINEKLIKVFDTIEIKKDRLVIRYIKLPGDTIKLEGNCLPDTLIIEKPIIREVIKPADEPRIKWFFWVFIGIIGTVISLILIKR
jgi:signal peptidase I